MEKEETFKTKLKKTLIGIWMWFALLLGWFLLTNLLQVRPVILPPIKDVLGAFVNLGDVIPKALAISMYMIMVGFVLGTGWRG